MWRVGLLATLLCTISCPGSKSQPDARGPAQTPGAARVLEEPTMIASDTPGLVYKLHEGVEGAGQRQTTPPAKTTPLTATEVQSVLARLLPIAGQAGDAKEFALRERSRPAPRPGQTVKTDFPPPQSSPPPDATEAGPLRVLRHMPDGEVPLAPKLSVTFSQPMVAITSYAELEKLPSPVKITPQPAGRWRWIGAKTLLFEARGELERLPMATEYTVEVPAGTRSAGGATLAQAERFTFATPPPKVVTFVPQDGPTTREPLIFIELDQKIDPQAVLASITTQASGQTVSLRVASAEEIKADAQVRELVTSRESDGKRDRLLVLRPSSPLPADAGVTVRIGPGTPSAEGPRTTTEAQQFGFRTYGPMRIVKKSCQGGKEERCPPFSSFWVELSNPVDAKKFARDMVKIEPAIPGQKIVAQGSSISISGATKGRTSYRAVFSGKIPDAFGQTMGQDETVTFVTSEAGKALFTTGGQFVVLDPVAQAKTSVYSVNHGAIKVKLFAAGPGDWDRFAKYMREEFRRETYPPDPPLRLVSSETVAVKGEPDELTETRLDLSKALTSGSGSVVVMIEPPVRPKDRWQWQPVIVWTQVTSIGLDAMVDHEELVGWATSLADGKPLDGVELSVEPSGQKGATARDGTLRLPLAPQAGNMLVAKWKGQIAFLPENTSFWNDRGSWARTERGDSLRWYVADDRHLYKPGEEVKIKGWIRRVGGGEEGDVMALDGAASRVDYVVRDSRGNEVLRGTARLNALGGFDTSFKLPPTMNLGDASMQLTAVGSKLDGETESHSFQVQEFRRPEFEVSAQPSEGPFFVGGRATVTVNARYYAGGALSNAETTWTVSASRGSFTPPNRDDYVFGRQPSWYDSYARRRRTYGPIRGLGGAPGQRDSFQGHTDSGGKHVLGIDFLAMNPPEATSVVAQATVMDVNRQAWTATQALLVHPATLYVGLRSDREYVQKGEAIRVDAVVVDLDGKTVLGRKVAMRAVRLDWEWTDDGIETIEADPTDCAVTSADQPQRCEFRPAVGGLYRVSATLSDDKGRKNLSELSVWVAGGKLPPQRGVQIEQARLLPSKKEYRAGETAEVLVIPPFFPAEGVMTLRRSGIFRVERFTMTDSSHTLKVKIEDAWTPNVFIQVDLVGAAPRTNDSGDVDDKLPRRPALASGELSLSIPPLSRKLALEVRPGDDKLEPGGQTSVALTLRDAAGEPVAKGEVAVVVVDEAVLALTGYKMPDPLPLFYAARDAGARDYHLRQSVLLAKPEELAAGGGAGDMRNGAPGGAMPPPAPSMAAPQRKMMAMEASGLVMADKAAPAQSEAIKVRSDFNALAVFAPAVATDAKGQATVSVKLPDNLTRYRVMAIAVAGGRQFGAGESTITARLPLMVRPSPPRFLNFGDTLELPVVLQNQTDRPLEVSVAARTANLELTAGAGHKVTVPANDRVEVRFPAAAMKAGTARFQLAAVASANPRWSDAAELELPVWTPATSEAFATYGTIDAGAIAQPVKMPEGVFPQFGGLEVTTSSTALQALTDAVLYLVRYPYECSEQMASRVLAVASLKDVLTAFQAAGLPPPAEMLAAVARDIEMLRRLQNGDGGFGFWKRGEESWPFLTLHVAHALARARDKGFAVPQPMIEAVRPYLKDVERHIPATYGPEVRRALVAYSLYVRLRLGERDVAKAQRLAAEAGGVGKLPLEAVAWIYPVLSGDAQAGAELAAIRTLVGNRLEETAGAAHFVTSYSDGNYLLLHSDRRVDALFLEGLIIDQPKSDVIPKLVTGLLGHRKAGRWGSTQENAWVLLALDKYFNTYEKVTPDFVARVWLGPQFAGEHAFKGRTTERHAVEVPMMWLAEKGKALSQLIVAKDGAGRLYYRIGMSYAPTDLKPAPRDNGFVVTREYEAVDEKGDVRRDADGTWRVKAGARVRVRVTMVAPARRTHVALVDPVPAGLEPLNPALAVTAEIPRDPKDPRAQGQGGRFWWWGPWYEHQNMRDERVEAFASLLWEGVHDYSYVARATTPGVFVVPPPKAEEMYEPETFGRGAGDRLIVE